MAKQRSYIIIAVEPRAGGKVTIPDIKLCDIGLEAAALVLDAVQKQIMANIMAKAKKEDAAS